MRFALAIFLLLVAPTWPQTSQTEKPQILTFGTNTSLRGLSVSVVNNQRVLWATGSNGVVRRSPDGGKSWPGVLIEGASQLDFRGVQSFGADIAYVFSVGNDDKSHIYKTSDAGKTWRTQYSDKRPAFFL
ncbi:MAG: hypothetical protein JO119_12625, partial [Acidobacteria bacterium]|nr:hypothetical protein [Acidobacteriota bacterium]